MRFVGILNTTTMLNKCRQKQKRVILKQINAYITVYVRLKCL